MTGISWKVWSNSVIGGPGPGRPVPPHGGNTVTSNYSRLLSTTLRIKGTLFEPVDLKSTEIFSGYLANESSSVLIRMMLYVGLLVPPKRQQFGAGFSA